jgi:hypothetical protein
MVSTPQLKSDERARAERAARIAAMLDRWAAEDVSEEPDWDVGEINPVTLRALQSMPLAPI